MIGSNIHLLQTNLSFVLRRFIIGLIIKRLLTNQLSNFLTVALSYDLLDRGKFQSKITQEQFYVEIVPIVHTRVGRPSDLGCSSSSREVSKVKKYLHVNKFKIHFPRVRFLPKLPYITRHLDGDLNNDLLLCSANFRLHFRIFAANITQTIGDSPAEERQLCSLRPPRCHNSFLDLEKMVS